MGLAAIYHHASNLNSWACSYYSKSTTLRYSSYALGVFAIMGGYHRYDRLKIELPLLTISLVIIVRHIRSNGKNNHPLPLNLEQKLSMISKLFSTIFTLALIWGIETIGSQLRVTVVDGKNILQGIRHRDPFAVLKALNYLGCTISLSLPLCTFFLRKADAYFHSNLDETMRASFTQFLNENPLQKEKPFRINLSDWLLTLLLDPKKIEFTFGKEGTEKCRLNTDALSAIRHLRQITLPDLNKISFMVSCILEALWKQKTVSHPSSPLLSKIKRIANSIFNHGFNFFLLSTRVYCYPVTLAVAFCCGLVFPTQLRLKQQVKKSWEIAPDFVGLSLKKKCDYLFYRTLKTLVPLYLSYPMAVLQGLYLAEDFRYYLIPQLNKWITLPIKPLVFGNRWRDFLNEDFNKIQTESDLKDDPDYTHFRQQILQGKSPRKILDLNKEFTAKEVQDGFKKLSPKVHPDKLDASKREEATTLFKCIKQARDFLLSDEEQENLLQESPPAPENGIDETSQPD